MLHMKALHFGNLTLGENEEIVVSSTIIVLLSSKYILIIISACVSVIHSYFQRVA